MLRTRRWLGAALLVLFLVVASTGLAAAQDGVTLQLEPVGGSSVSGTARLTAQGNGTQVSLEVSGLASGSTVRATLQAGTCDTPGASTAALPELTAEASGAASATGPILFRGTEQVALEAIADGAHTITVANADGVLACGIIPEPGTTGGSAGLPATGMLTLWMPALLLVGASLLASGAALWLWARHDSARDNH